MAADRATVSVSASLLPDEIKTSIGGTTIYDIDDIGNNNNWFYSLTLIGTSSEDLIKDAINFVPGGLAGQGAHPVDIDVDDLGFLFVKHTGTIDGVVVSTNSLCINLSNGTPNGTSVGDIIIKPNECFFARLGHTRVDNINGISLNEDASGNNIQVQVLGIADNGGV